MEIYTHIYNKSTNRFDAVGIIDTATSIIWSKKYQGAGDFEVYIRASRETLELFSENEVMLTKAGDDGGMLAENIELKTDFENGNYLTITGRSLESVLARRIIPAQVNYTGTAENALRSIVISNFLAQIPAARYMPIMAVATSHGYAETIDRQFTGKNCLDTIADICTAVGYGFKITRSGGYFLFDLYKPVDRSAQQTDRPFIMFSPEFDNIGNTDYRKNKADFYNSIYVAGQGQGSERIIYNLSTTETGFYRREKWVDSRNTSSTTADGELTPTQYRKLLRDQAEEELHLRDIVTSFSGEIITSNNGYAYGIDYGLGDIVSVKNEYGIEGTAHVAEITEVEDETGYRQYPTLSEWQEIEEDET